MGRWSRQNHAIEKHSPQPGCRLRSRPWLTQTGWKTRGYTGVWRVHQPRFWFCGKNVDKVLHPSSTTLSRKTDNHSNSHSNNNHDNPFLEQYNNVTRLGPYFVFNTWVHFVLNTFTYSHVEKFITIIMTCARKQWQTLDGSKILGCLLFLLQYNNILIISNISKWFWVVEWADIYRTEEECRQTP